MYAYVLVAEVDPKQAELVRRYLSHERHTVLVVSDGRSAIDEVRRQPLDLLMLDVMMPGVEGLGVWRGPTRPSTPLASAGRACCASSGRAR